LVPFLNAEKSGIVKGSGGGRVQSVGVGVPLCSPYTSVRAALDWALARAQLMRFELGWKMLAGVVVNASLLVTLGATSPQKRISIGTVVAVSHSMTRSGSNVSGKHATHKVLGGWVYVAKSWRQGSSRGGATGYELTVAWVV
jgi:hypothetical protein